MDNWFLPPESFKFGLVGPPYEIAGPLTPEKINQDSKSIELKYNLQFNDYTKQSVETSVIVNFVNDFPIDFKSGGFVLKLKWKI